MSLDKRFDDIRPYTNDEIPAAMERLASESLLDQVFLWLYPGQPSQDWRNKLRSVKSSEELQERIMYPAAEIIIKRTISGFSSSGEENIPLGKGVLYISNHRDIVLDATLQQLVLYRNGIPTSEISFGSNLMQSPVIMDLGKSNKMYKVVRKSVNMRDLVKNSRLLSDYIRDTINRGTSVWIAQHDGRSKEGNDLTDPGLLNMLSMSMKKDRVGALASLHIVPVAVSYEIEPCDILKVCEVQQTKKQGFYKKASGEDLISIVTGITQKKGKVHITLCPAITVEDLKPYAGFAQTEYFYKVATLINQRIYSGYKLYGINYAAFDKITGTNEFREHYTEKDIKLLESREMLLPASDSQTKAALKDLLRRLYANPVMNSLNKAL